MTRIVSRTKEKMAAAKKAGNERRYKNLQQWLRKRENILNHLNKKLESLKPPTNLTEAPKPEAPAPKPEAPAPAPAPAPAANIIQRGQMPAVDLSLIPTGAVGYNTVRIGPSGTPSSPAGGPNQGQFRTICKYSHMSNDDPLVYPNQQGAAHLHTFFGNTTTDSKTDVNNLKNVGDTTCAGGTVNRSAYWVPSLIDTTTNRPLMPLRGLFYYKTWDANNVTSPPKGLRMIAGNTRATPNNPQNQNPYARKPLVWSCVNGGSSSTSKTAIPDCNGTIRMSINFPMCWDAVNLDSPSHQAHMSYHVKNTCPASHPVLIPDITFNIDWQANGTKNLRLSSDNYAGGAGGESGHGDWVNGWDPAIMATIVNNCLKG